MIEIENRLAGNQAEATDGSLEGRPSSAHYNVNVECAQLSDVHLEMLHNSAISDEVIASRGYRTITNPSELEALGFAPGQCRVPGLLLPLHATDGGNSLFVYRPDNARVVDERNKPKGSDGKYPCRVIKYEYPRGAPMRLDCPPVCKKALSNPGIRLWITEGQKKADALASTGACAVALLGVWNFKGKNDLGGTTILADFDYIALDGRDVCIVFDSDLTAKPQVRKAMERLTEHLQRKKAHVGVVYLPPSGDGKKQGVDDYVASGHGITELERLIEAPRPAPKAAAPIVEILDAAPDSIRRPLALVGGHAYAATWLHVRITASETLNSKGEIVRHNPPLVTTDRRLFVIRDDGRIFGDGSDAPLEEMGLQVQLSDPPPDEKLWSAAGVKRYQVGERADPKVVFAQLVSVYDRFVDFSRSLAPQEDMCALSACLSLATWFAPACSVVGYPWPNGDRGSGKTKWGLIWVATSYLGQMLTMGGSFAALRDLADAGATMLFDDAENLSDAKKCDPDKRALLLAGNRRGTRIPLKETRGDKWVIRWVDAFCPRGFTAIALPDNVLESRSIVVPLVRTGDARRGNLDPENDSSWPCDRQRLKDELWALALRLLPEAEKIWLELNDEVDLIGRDFEPWRALIAVARLMERHGVDGLESAIRQAMTAYQRERADILEDDWTRTVVQALVNHLEGAIRQKVGDISDVSFGNDVSFVEVALSATRVAELVQGLIGEDEPDPWPTPKRIGRIMKRLRFQQHRTGTRREWRLGVHEIMAAAKAYGVVTVILASGASKQTSLGKLMSQTSLPDGDLDTVGEEVARLRSDVDSQIGRDPLTITEVERDARSPGYTLQRDRYLALLGKEA